MLISNKKRRASKRFISISNFDVNRRDYLKNKEMAAKNKKKSASESDFTTIDEMVFISKPKAIVKTDSCNCRALCAAAHCQNRINSVLCVQNVNCKWELIA